jgi:hypothetical protein
MFGNGRISFRYWQQLLIVLLHAGILGKMKEAFLRERKVILFMVEME